MVFGGGMFRPSNTAQKVKFLLKNFCSKCDQIHSFLRIWSHLLEKSLMENSIWKVSKNSRSSSMFHWFRGS